MTGPPWRPTSRASTSPECSRRGSTRTRSSSRTAAPMAGSYVGTFKQNPPGLPLGGDRLLDIVRPRTRCERDEALLAGDKKPRALPSERGAAANLWQLGCLAARDPLALRPAVAGGLP